MEVRSGYKQSEVGVVPEDWNIKSVEDLCIAVLDCHHSTPVWTQSGAVVIRNQNIRDGKLDLSEPSFTDDSHFVERTRRAIPSYGDLVITREAPMGLVCMIPEGLRCCLGQRMVLLRINRDVADRRYILYSLLTENLQRAISIGGGTGSTVSNLRIPVLKRLQIAAPKMPEQVAIAEALGDVDELLSGLDKLIAKKRDLKQAAMQQLLTGKTRLPGFDREWEVRRLGDILTIRHGKDQKGVVSSNGAYPILATGGQIGWANQWLYNKPSVLIGRKGTIDRPQYMNQPFWTVDTLFYSEMRLENVAKYFYYRFCLIDWHRYNEASGVPSLNARTIEAIELPCPMAQEQTAIADALSGMDAELTALEARREKTRFLKQGMMQELLTGKTRLV